MYNSNITCALMELDNFVLRFKSTYDSRKAMQVQYRVLILLDCVNVYKNHSQEI